MTQAALAQPETRAPSGESRVAPDLRGLYAEWNKYLHANPDPERADGRDYRMAWTNQRLKDWRQGVVGSWKELKPGQVKRLTRALREASGSGPNYRSLLIAKLACELWGRDWDHELRARLQERFQLSTPGWLTPADAHSLIEELVSRIARRDGIVPEEVRKKFSSRKS